MRRNPISLHHCLHSDSASPKPDKGRRATLNINRLPIIGPTTGEPLPALLFFCFQPIPEPAFGQVGRLHQWLPRLLAKPWGVRRLVPGHAGPAAHPAEDTPDTDELRGPSVNALVILLQQTPQLHK